MSISDTAKSYLDEHPVYLDTETTGMDGFAEVIELGILDDNGNVLFEKLIRPQGRMDPAAARVHGITLAELSSASTWEEIWPEAEAALMGRRVGIYNRDFDLRLMKQSHSRSFLRWSLPDQNFFDIMGLYARFRGDWDQRKRNFRNHSLEMACLHCNIHVPNAHRAIADCLRARALLHHMAGVP